MNVLVTGGAGYIGSHACQRLIADGHTVVSLDNLYRGHKTAMDIIAEEAEGRLTFVPGAVGDRQLVDKILAENDIDTVMHFAALAYVGESVTDPLSYWRAITAESLSLIETCDAAGIERFVFSSTCASYGEPAPEFIPIAENTPQAPINPYGRAKLAVEKILFDYADAMQMAGKPFAFAALRYFNVAGSDRQTRIGEDHKPETHLIPIVLQAALGQREKVTIFGTDYDTPDGTCIRDYVHVEDLIDAHVTVMDALQPGDRRTYNLGIGKGYSVKEIIDACKRVTGKEFAVTEGQRRPGDPPKLFANPSKIKNELGWSASITDLDEIIDTAWRWFRTHPDGYNE